MLIRPATAAEMEEPVEFPADGTLGSVDQDGLRVEATAGRMRPEWTWFADDGSRIVARALWWGRSPES